MMYYHILRKDFHYSVAGIRNNLLDADAIFSKSKANQVTSWKHVIEVYENDSIIKNYKVCPKLTDLHVFSNKIKKVKVKIASQVFWQSVSAVIRFLQRYDCWSHAWKDLSDYCTQEIYSPQILKRNSSSRVYPKVDVAFRLRYKIRFTQLRAYA